MSERTFGPFDIKRELGQGGFSIVYEAYDREQNRPVALKLFDENAVMNNTLQHRFLREIEVSRRLRHRNIVKVYRAGFYNNQGYISLRLMKGGTLQDLHYTQGPLPPARIARIVRHIATALDYAHSQNVLHRDIKPSNVLLHENGVACLADFGLTKVQGMATVTSHSDVIGSTHYMAPEQVRGLRNMTELSDVYSLGVILYELATGKRPFENKSQARVLQAIITDPHPPPRSVNARIGPAVAAVLDKALVKAPSARYQLPLDLSNAYYDALEKDGVQIGSRSQSVAALPLGTAPQEVLRPDEERPKNVTSQLGFWLAIGGLILALLLLLLFASNLM